MAEINSVSDKSERNFAWNSAAVGWVVSCGGSATTIQHNLIRGRIDNSSSAYLSLTPSREYSSVTLAIMVQVKLRSTLWFRVLPGGRTWRRRFAVPVYAW